MSLMLTALGQAHGGSPCSALPACLPLLDKAATQGGHTTGLHCAGRLCPRTWNHSLGEFQGGQEALDYEARKQGFPKVTQHV